MEKQLICFIDPSKFCRLLGKEKSDNIGFQNNNNDLIGFIGKNGESKFGTFSSEKAQEATILLVPDSFDLPKNYTPIIRFKILYHGKTIKELRVDPLTTSINCEGSDKKPEYPDTIYHKIAQFIGSEQIQETSGFEEIYNSIPLTNNKLETALEFLHGCLTKKPADLSQLKDFETQKQIIVKGIDVKIDLKALWLELKDKPLDDIPSFEAFRDGLMAMAGVKN